MELKQLESFVAIAEAGTLSGAAQRLGLTQPILSRQIRALEQEFGARLYARTGRGVVLSEAGRLLEEYARGILEQVANARSAIHELQSTPSGRVVLGMPPSVGAVLTAPLVRRFQEGFPRVSLGVIEGFSGHVLEWLSLGRVDVAALYLYNTPRSAALVTRHIATDELCLLGPADDPAGVGDGAVKAARLAGIPLILPSRPHGLRLLIDQALSAIGKAADVRIEIDAMPSTLSLVEGGAGYTILSYSCVDPLIRAGRLRYWPIVQPTITRELVVTTSAQRPVTPAARALMDIVAAEVRALVDEGRWVPRT
jgi:LysR family nitrogen assimilation transcriptional regulator